MKCLFSLIFALFFVYCVQGRIINGQDSELSPYTAMVTGNNVDYRTFGGGSFISLKHVLTAANLIYKMDWWYVDYGKDTIGGMYYESATAIMHPTYNPESFGNDIGIVILLKAADPNIVIPIPLPGVTNVPYVNEQGIVSGFGMKQQGDSWVMNHRKQTGYFRRIDDDLCAAQLARNGVTVTPHWNFCAKGVEHVASICYGDSGSGMTVYIDEVNTIVGVVSVFTNMCHPDYPALFTKVAPYYDWIKEIISTT